MRSTNQGHPYAGRDPVFWGLAVLFRAGGGDSWAPACAGAAEWTKGEFLFLETCCRPGREPGPLVGHVPRSRIFAELP
jgi:hypothetical protein